MRSAILLIVLSLFCVSVSLAQSPNDGKIQANAYVNSYLKISYACPKILTPVDTSALHLGSPSARGDEFLLFSARQGDEPFGVVILAEKLKVPTPHTKGIQDAADFMARVKRGFDPAGNWKKLAETHITNVDGIPIDELDYTIFGEYDSAVVAQVGDFLVVFKCNAKSASDLAEMTGSAIALHRVK